MIRRTGFICLYLFFGAATAEAEKETSTEALLRSTTEKHVEGKVEELRDDLERRLKALAGKSQRDREEATHLTIPVCDASDLL